MTTQQRRSKGKKSNIHNPLIEKFVRIWNPSTTNALFQVWEKNCLDGFGEVTFLKKNCHCIFIMSFLSSLEKRVRSFIWTKLNPLCPKILCFRFGWNWSNGSRKDVKYETVYRQMDWQTDRRGQSRVWLCCLWY